MAKSYRFVDEDGYVGRRTISAEDAQARNRVIYNEGIEDLGTWQPVGSFCVDCGCVGERKGHMGCQFPQN